MDTLILTDVISQKSYNSKDITIMKPFVRMGFKSYMFQSVDIHYHE